MTINLPVYPLLAVILLVTIAACSPAVPAEPPVSSSPDPDEPVTSSPGDSGGAVPSGPANPYAPQPGDEKLTRGEAFVNSADLLVLESFPPQFRLSLAGDLPTPCHQLRVQISEPDAAGKIEVEVYSLADPERMCIQVLQPFEASLPLDYLPGKYTLWLKGAQIGAMDVP
jgi:hypothetical protein